MASTGCLITDCDWAFIRACHLEAFQVTCPEIFGPVKYVRFDRTATDAVPQNDLSDLFDEVDTPVYITGVVIPAWWTDTITQDDIKKHGFENKPDLKLTVSIPWFEDNGGIVVKMEDRFELTHPITGATLYELVKMDIGTGMGNRILTADLFLKTVD